MKRNFLKLLSALFIVTLLLTSCAQNDNSILTASGTLSAVEASIAPEISGTVVEVNVEEGDEVSKGQNLFKIEQDYIQAQYDQATAAVAAAEASVEAARGQAASAQAQYELTLQAALAQELPARSTAWNADVEEDYRPAWYYSKAEMIAAAQAQVDAAQSNLDDAVAALESEQSKVSSKGFIAAENRLSSAQVALTVADQTLKQAENANNEDLEDAANEIKDDAQAEFDAALSEYNRMLTTTAADAILQARARVAIAQSSLDNARTALLSQQTGDQSLQVIAAQKAAEAAASTVTQAEAGLEQAKQAQRLAELQLDRATVDSPIEGVVLTRDLEVGELAVAGGTVMRIAKLDNLELTVYLPEDQYGKVNIGDEVSITVDSFVDEEFTGTIQNIASEAEFTPRNVQTEEGRKATVFAIKIVVANPEHKLKPGMPADVEFFIK